MEISDFFCHSTQILREISFDEESRRAKSAILTHLEAYINQIDKIQNFYILQN